MACNADCLFCWRQHDDATIQGGNLSPARWRRVIDEAAALGVEYLRVIGEGEPTLYPGFHEILKHIKRRGIRGFLCTNGSMLTPDQIHDLVHFGWDWVNFSMEGHDAATHDGLTQLDGSFDKIVAATARFTKLKRAFRTETPGINFGMALTRRNYLDIPKVFPLAAKLGVFAVNLEPVTVNTPRCAPLKLTPEEARRFVTEIGPEAVEVGRRLGVQTNIPDLTERTILSTNQVHLTLFDAADGQRGLLGAPCWNPFWFLHLRANGQVGSCGFWRPVHVEDARDQSLEEVWFGDYYQRMRDWMLGGGLFDMCADCNLGFVEDNLGLRRDLVAALAAPAQG